MAISKITLNGITQMDVTQKTVTAGTMLNNVTALKNDGTDITGNIASKSSSDLTISGNAVTAPAGYYGSAASKVIVIDAYIPISPNYRTAYGGIETSDNGDGSYTVTGTTAGSFNVGMGISFALKAGKVYCFDLNSSSPENSSCYFYTRGYNGTTNWVRSGQYMTVSSDSSIDFMLYSAASGVSLDTTIRPYIAAFK